MKTKLIILFSCCLFLNAYAVSPIVHDPTMFFAAKAQWLKTSAELKLQYDKLVEQTEFARKGLESVQKVNEKIRNLQQTKKMMDLQIKLLGKIGDDLNGLSAKTFYDKREYERYKARLNEQARRVKVISDLGMSILKDNTFNMTDKDRFDIINNALSEAEKLEKEIEAVDEISKRQKEKREKLLKLTQE